MFYKVSVVVAMFVAVLCFCTLKWNINAQSSPCDGLPCNAVEGEDYVGTGGQTEFVFEYCCKNEPEDPSEPSVGAWYWIASGPCADGELKCYQQMLNDPDATGCEGSVDYTGVCCKLSIRYGFNYWLDEENEECWNCHRAPDGQGGWTVSCGIDNPGCQLYEQITRYHYTFDDCD